MINLFYENLYSSGVVRGPVKVISNTIRAFEEKKIEFSSNSEKYEYNFFLSWNMNYYETYLALRNKNKFLVGPQIWPFSQEFSLLENTTTLIVPSQWVGNMLKNKFSVSEDRLLIWPCPIYVPDIDNNLENSIDCLLYFKNRSEKELFEIKKFLDSKNISHIQLSYGEYTQEDFKKALSLVKFCVILDNTESQGIAIQEMMSVNKPLFVWDKSVWDHQGEQYAVPASSVPYWSEVCGKKFVNIEDIDTSFQEFIDNFDKYSPQQFIYENLSPEKSIKIILDHYLK